MSGKVYQPPWILILWPGLPSLWLRGDPAGLALAVLFAGLLQLALLTTFVWPGWLGFPWRGVLWLGLTVGWSWAAFWRREATMGPDRRWDSDSVFREAQREYLRGNWSHAERALRRLLRWDFQDAEVRMILASLYRRTGRCRAAMEQLAAVEAGPMAAQWHWEVGQERQLVARDRQEQQNRVCRNDRDGRNERGEQIDSSDGEMREWRHRTDAA